MQQITAVTPTICKLMGIPPPNLSTKEIIRRIIESSMSVIGNSAVEKCLIYAPDAIGDCLFQDYFEDFEPVIELAPIDVKLLSVFPTKTPVCFASMFTGALPEQHGIRKYEKPVLTCDTIFDALIREGKKIAIATVADSSISLIFRNRALDYYIEENDQRVNDRVLELMDRDYDLILVYNQEYDDTMHGTTPRSADSLAAMRRHISSFVKLSGAFLARYEDFNRLILFSPDHGTHIDPVTGKGDHGLDTPEDMEVRSFWGIYAKTKRI